MNTKICQILWYKNESYISFDYKGFLQYHFKVNLCKYGGKYAEMCVYSLNFDFILVH